ncbi:DUF58 domain-containing protein [Virgibacillus flavescens]|uniref:DUF58 domain-containing protein n=1 Tax=Virgibacillus flavescens TaxID=1611422 RepID=UPI003D35149D
MKQTNWNTNSIKNTRQKYDLLLLFVVILTIISLITNQTLIFLVVGFVAIYVWFIRIYDKHIGRKLILENQKRSIRLFEDEEGHLEINLYNHSILPFHNTDVSFTTNHKISSDEFVRFTRSRLNHYHLPMVLHGKSAAHLSIPIQAMKRGVTMVDRIQLTFPHLLNFEQHEMKYAGQYQTEILVYPRLIPVAGIEEFPYNSFGNQVTPYSPFEDLLSPVGTRDYVHSDPFHRIHWKASAKNQTLQTKVYERNQNISWTIIVNIAEISPLGNVYMSDKIEKFLSQAAFICQTITKQGYPVEIYINASRIGNVPFFLKEDSGTEHLKKILELLARIEDDNNVIPIDTVIHRIDQSAIGSNMFILIGAIDTYSSSVVQKWNKRGNHIYQVNDSENGAYLSTWSMERFFAYEAE